MKEKKMKLLLLTMILFITQAVFAEKKGLVSQEEIVETKAKKGSASINDIFVKKENILIQDNSHDQNIQLIFFFNKYHFKQKDYIAVLNGVRFLNNFYKTKMDLELPDEVGVHMRMFGDLMDYRVHQKKTVQQYEKAYGYYISNFTEICIYHDKKIAFYTLKTAFHELNHFFVDMVTHECPIWLNEGLSVYFQNMVLFKKNVLIKSNDDFDWYLKNQIWGKNNHDIKKMLQMSLEEWKKKENMDTYPLASSLIYFLMDSLSGQNVVKKLLHYYHNKDNAQIDSIKAMDALYPGGYRKFEKDYRNWILKIRKNHWMDI